MSGTFLIEAAEQVRFREGLVAVPPSPEVNSHESVRRHQPSLWGFGIETARRLRLRRDRRHLSHQLR